MNGKADIGLVGLAVMGQNLVLNMNDKGFTVAVFNRTVSKVDEFLADAAQGTPTHRRRHSIEEIVGLLKRPRKIMLMVKAGEPVDEFIEQLIPLLEPGDLIIDGGNSHFPDTIRRTKYLDDKGLLYIGTGRLGRRRGRAQRPVASCPAAAPRPGRWSSRSSRRSRPRPPTASPAATGSARTAPATTSRWCTTASSTATCS